MPIANIQDTTGVEQKLQEILSSADVGRRLQAIRELFVGILDYDSADQLVSLESAGNAQLPKDAHLAARRDGVTVAYMPLDDAPTNRVNGIVASAAAKALSNTLADDLLLVFTNRDRDQLHIISPDLSGSRPKLQRLVAYRDQLQRTVPEQIANMWDNYGNKGKTLREAIAEAFSVEPVTKEFFGIYRKLFEDAEEQITGFTQAEEEQKHLFTQTLFNRLMFVYFLSRKGWLKFKGDTDYLKALWNDYDPRSSTRNFYLTRLKPLFFTGLNNPDYDNLPEEEKALIGTVPFLNGGLFEETALDKRQNINVPDETIGDILADLFDRFNFTVMESTPYDVEVAVDPEMLGKVFEELVTERHDSGAYYTPRPVVSFMCREALKGYLEGKAEGLDTDSITRFVDEYDTSGVSLIAAPRISEALSALTVVDPACGSGAYLLGMMQELIELQTVLYNIGVDPKKIYDLKLEIIQRNLYGVDNDEFAVNIAMLRMWLSLAIDYEGEIPEPLPNLDLKVVFADSLRGPDPRIGTEVQGTLGRDVAQIKHLAELKGNYMRSYRAADKERVKEDIQRVEGTLRQGMREVKGGFKNLDWTVDFAEVFADKRGFDIVIANPPYGIKIEDRRSTAIRHTDSYTNFIALATEIAPSGVMAYITPTSWETGEKFKEFRQFLFKRMALQSIVNLPYDVFDTPFVDTAITVGIMGRTPSPTFGLANLEKRVRLDLTQISAYLDSVNWAGVTQDTNSRIPQLGWAANLITRVASQGTPLGELTRSKRGIADYKFNILGKGTVHSLPFFTGQVQRYTIVPSEQNLFVEVTHREESFHQGDRILARRLVTRDNRLSFAHTSDSFVVKEAILPFKPKFDDSEKLSMLLGILNSSLISFLFQTRSTAATKDDFRQVTLAGLRELPMIFPNDQDLEKELVGLVETRELSVEQSDATDTQIDEIIYQIYGVTASEQEAIKEWLGRPG